jgi:glycosyltransferase involved in cell wall biosynthesis
MTMFQQTHSSGDILIIAAYCNPCNPNWFSPGRQRKLVQVEALLISLGFIIHRYSIAPEQSNRDNFHWVSLCNFSWPPLRFVQLVCNAFFVSGKDQPAEVHQWLWLYNTRLAEAMVALVFLLKNHRLKLFLQLEDLPAARHANAGFRGWLDNITTLMLTRRAACVSAVSQPVAEAFSKLTSYSLDRIVLLPPLLDEAYQRKIASRHTPFGNPHYTALYAGGYGPDKGVDDLLSAFKQLSKNNIRLMLLGPVPKSLRDQLKNQAAIDIIGMVSDERLFSAYADADIVINPHRPILNSAFIFPFKLIEIMASGALPLTTAMPGLDSYNLPPECFFEGSHQLALRLDEASGIWERHRSQIEHLAMEIRERYSMGHAKSVLDQHLGDN